MYLPKSKYQGNLYAKPNEFVFADDNTPYEGPCFKTYKGEFYSGKKPSSSSRLIKFVPNEPLDEKEQAEFVPYTMYDFIRNNPRERGLRRTQPIVRYYPSITQQDLQRGYMYRYFAQEKATNEILEINAETYTSLVSQDVKYFYPAYRTTFVKWYFTNNNINTNTAKVLEPSIPGITQYLNLS